MSYVLSGRRGPRPNRHRALLGGALLAATGILMASRRSPRLVARRQVSTDPLRRGPIPALFARMDTRPSHRVMAARVARQNLTSPLLFEKLAQAAAEAAPHLSEELPALAAEMREDAVRLREIADDPAMPSYAQIVALHALASLGKADDAFVRARFEAVAADPDEGIGTLVDFLEKRGALAGALATVEAALQRSRDKDSLTRAYLQAFAELKAAGIAPHVLARVAVALGKERGLDIA